MTTLTRPVSRVTACVSRARLVVATMAPEGLYLREQGTRKARALLLPWGVAWTKAGDLAARVKKAKAKK